VFDRLSEDQLRKVVAALRDLTESFEAVNAGGQG
jgi:hypothetical protein